MGSLSENLIIEAALDLRHPDNGAKKNTAGVGSVAPRAQGRTRSNWILGTAWFDVMDQ